MGIHCARTAVQILKDNDVAYMLLITTDRHCTICTLHDRVANGPQHRSRKSVPVRSEELFGETRKQHLLAPHFAVLISAQNVSLFGYNQEVRAVVTGCTVLCGPLCARAPPMPRLVF